jgi:hypothetical protein
VKSLWKWLIAESQSTQFVSFWAHFFAAGWIILICSHSYREGLAVLITTLAAAKEYWFDATYEIYPRQTFLDNTEDFVGWVSGAWVSIILAPLLGICK